MRRLLTVSGLVLQVLYFVFTALSYGEYEYSGAGVGKGFAFMIYSIIAAVLCLGVYLAEVVYAFVKKYSVFNLVKLLAVIGSIPLCYFCIGGDVVSAMIWNAYFVGVFLLETVALFCKNE